MFRLTNATRGGMLLMMVFFYSAFVLGVSLWIETDGENPECLSFPQCSYNLMRLTFYDGTGFDLAYSLTTKHRFLFFLLMVYMCLTSFGILNGLVGIFGTAFAVASDEAFNDTDNEDEDDEGDIQDNDDNNNEYNKYSSYRDLLPKNNYDDDDHNNGDNGENDSSGDEIGGGGGTEVYRRSSTDHTNNNNNMDDPMNLIFQRAQSRSRLETKQLEQKLKGKLGGKSNFALKELTKLASAETHAQQEYAQQQGYNTVTDSNSHTNEQQQSQTATAGTAAGAGGGTLPLSIASPDSSSKRRTLRDVIKSNNFVRAHRPAVHPVLPTFKASNSNEQAPYSPPNPFLAPKKVNKNLNAAVGMFANLKHQGSNKGKGFLAHHTSHNAGHNNGHNASGAAATAGPFKEYMAAQAHNNMHNTTTMAATSVEIKVVQASIGTLQRTVEGQNTMILNLCNQIQNLTQQLQQIHPNITPVPVPEVGAGTASSLPLTEHKSMQQMLFGKIGFHTHATNSNSTETAHPVAPTISEEHHPISTTTPNTTTGTTGTHIVSTIKERNPFLARVLQSATATHPSTPQQPVSTDATAAGTGTVTGALGAIDHFPSVAVHPDPSVTQQTSAANSNTEDVKVVDKNTTPSSQTQPAAPPSLSTSTVAEQTRGRASSIESYNSVESAEIGEVHQYMESKKQQEDKEGQHSTEPSPGQAAAGPTQQVQHVQTSNTATAAPSAATTTATNPSVPTLDSLPSAHTNPDPSPVHPVESRSKPRKSPIPGARSHSKGKSSVLNVMGRITPLKPTTNSVFFEESDEHITDHPTSNDENPSNNEVLRQSDSPELISLEDNPDSVPFYTEPNTRENSLQRSTSDNNKQQPHQYMQETKEEVGGGDKNKHINDEMIPLIASKTDATQIPVHNTTKKLDMYSSVSEKSDDELDINID